MAQPNYVPDGRTYRHIFNAKGQAFQTFVQYFTVRGIVIIMLATLACLLAPMLASEIRAFVHEKYDAISRGMGGNYYSRMGEVNQTVDQKMAMIRPILWLVAIMSWVAVIFFYKSH